MAPRRVGGARAAAHPMRHGIGMVHALAGLHVFVRCVDTEVSRGIARELARRGH
jgi:hypothetical protein